MCLISADRCLASLAVTQCSSYAMGQDLMPDGLHPNAAGMELMAECLDPLVACLVAQPAADFGAADQSQLAAPRQAAVGLLMRRNQSPAASAA